MRISTVALISVLHVIASAEELPHVEGQVALSNSSADVSSTSGVGGTCGPSASGASEIDLSASWTLDPTSMTEIVCEVGLMEADHSEFTFGVASDTLSTTNTNLKVAHVWNRTVNFSVRVWDPDHPNDSHDVHVDFQMHVLDADWSIDVGNTGEVGSVVSFTSVATITCKDSTATGVTYLPGSQTGTAPYSSSDTLAASYLPSAAGACLWSDMTHNDGTWVAASYKFEVSSATTAVCQPDAAGTYASEVTVAQAGWVEVCVHFQ